ncbi:MAG: hypothetical protein P9X22_07365 [Candidatus Zapsychrus exili]|nr:hypothetical protein [Candidatus Zapsychrus exili]
MDKKELTKKLNKLGLPLFETSEEFDVNKALSEVVLSNEPRFLEGFPVLLANAAKNYDFDYDMVEQLLPSEDDKESFRYLFLLSLSLYKSYHLKFSWTNKYYENLDDDDRQEMVRFRNYLAYNSGNFLVYKHLLSPQRVKNTFQSYFSEEALESQKKRAKHEELSLEYALSQVFSPKQKELFLKKVNGEKLSKTEKEYYSRAVKKKVVALANSELNSLAKNSLT